MIRAYDHNSPQAAARLVALAMFSDGHLDAKELERAESMGLHEQLGLSRREWHTVLHGLCKDMLGCTRLTWADACTVDALTLRQLLSEISDPTLRERVLALCLAVAEADRVITDGEALLLAAAVDQWGLPTRAPAGAANRQALS